MELTHEFSVSVPVDQAWALLTDLERVAPCMPGAELQDVAGDEYRGVVKVKVGPMTTQYKGVVSFRERDAVNHRAVLRAEGRDTKGQGNASATVTATLAPENGGTRVSVHTDLTITGKVAQFGRGVLADVSSKLLGQFVRALEELLLRSVAPAATRSSVPTVVDAPASPTAPAESRRIDAPPGEPIDLLATAGSSVIRGRSRIRRRGLVAVREVGRRFVRAGRAPRTAATTPRRRGRRYR
jgi:carbon monoxide dehydrogenase subunit G